MNPRGMRDESVLGSTDASADATDGLWGNSAPGDSTIFDAALDYAASGFRVVPLYGIVDGMCACRRVGCSSPGKHPTTRHGVDDASSDLATVDRWWSHSPHANVGLALALAGFFVLDIDVRHGGDLRTLERAGDIGDPAIVRTGGGGWHLVYAAPTDVPFGGILHDSAGVGIEVKTNGYIVAPPSLHISGGRYRTVSGSFSQVTRPPDWIIEAAIERPHRSALAEPVAPVGGALTPAQMSWARAARDAQVARVATALPGTRHSSLMSAGARLGRLVGGGALDVVDVRDALLGACQQNALLGEEPDKTIRDLDGALDFGLRNPRRPPLLVDGVVLLDALIASAEPLDHLLVYLDSPDTLDELARVPHDRDRWVNVVRRLQNAGADEGQIRAFLQSVNSRRRDRSVAS